MCLWVSYKKKYEINFFFAFFKSLKKGVGSRSGSNIRVADPDPHQNVTDPQQCKKDMSYISLILFGPR
jgi:hypothetical protein